MTVLFPVQFDGHAGAAGNNVDDREGVLVGSGGQLLRVPVRGPAACGSH